MSTTASKKKTTRGSAAFVGAGPGDANLLTVRAVELIGDASLVLHDTAVAAAVLTRIPEGVEVVDVDASGDASAASRAKQIADGVKAGRDVVRLVVGDPVVDGVLADEAPVLAKAKVAFEVVPGVSRATGVPAYAGVPIMGGKSRDAHIIDFRQPGTDWTAHASSGSTLVLLHAAESLDQVAVSLLGAGRSDRTPVSVTVRGTTTDQRTAVGTLDHIKELIKSVQALGDLSDAVVVVGDAVSARERLSWFETKPLFGWRVLVPRTKEQAGALSDQLVRSGAVPVEVPTISVEPPRTPQQMDRAIQGLVNGRYQWVAFTSANAVKAVREKFEEFGLDARAFAGLKVAAIGESTAAALVAFGVRPDLVPTGEQSSVGLLEDWPEYDDILDPINRIFLPRADIATETLVEGLTKLGWEIDDVTAYRTVRAAPPHADTREAIKSGGFDAVLFTSSSTVRNLIGIAGKPHATTVVACIGPQTAKTAEEHGLRVDVLAESASVEALAEGLAAYGEELRTAAVGNGEQVWRPSERRASARRKAK